MSLSTPQARAYRDLDPGAPGCREGLAEGWTALADIGRQTLAAGKQMDDDGWADPSDDETEAVAHDSKWKLLLRCSLQRHVVPATTRKGKPLSYTLGFLVLSQALDRKSL